MKVEYSDHAKNVLLPGIILEKKEKALKFLMPLLLERMNESGYTYCVIDGRKIELSVRKLDDGTVRIETI